MPVTRITIGMMNKETNKKEFLLNNNIVKRNKEETNTIENKLKENE